MLPNDKLLKSGRMESSTPQEGGTTDEEYYGQPEKMLPKVLLLTAKNGLENPKNLIHKCNVFCVQD